MCWCERVDGYKCDDCECEDRFRKLSTKERIIVQKILIGIEKSDTSIYFRNMVNEFEEKHGEVHNYNFTGIEYCT